MKKHTYLMLIAGLCVILAAQPALAGSKQKHRWEGVAIGLGAAAILSGAFINHHHRDVVTERVTVIDRGRSSCEPDRYDRHDRRHHDDPLPPRGRGHWEIRKIWVPPVIERVWNPSHYNHRNEWIPGEWIEIERESGYWQEERIWVVSR